MIELKVLKRDTKDNTEHIRAKGLIPAVMYGSEFESTAVMIDDIEFRKLYRTAGTSNVITTIGDISGEMVLIQDMQVHVVSGQILNIDFKVVNKGETTEATVPIELTGESEAVKNSLGIMNFSHEEVVIETIPSKIPDHILVDISGLNNVGDGIKLSDIKIADDIKILDDMNTTIVSIIAVKEETESISAEDMQPERIGEKKETEESTE